MICKEDLRLGNYVNEQVLGNVRVSEINFNSVSLNSINLKTNKEVEVLRYVINYENIEPIHLTEDILLKCDAIKLDFKDFPSFNLKGLQINYINKMWIEYVSQIEITGLHHLQNIFYFRMNEELTINL